jgi:hypothetical protein
MLPKREVRENLIADMLNASDYREELKHSDVDRCRRQLHQHGAELGCMSRQSSKSTRAFGGECKKE